MKWQTASIYREFVVLYARVRALTQAIDLSFGWRKVPTDYADLVIKSVEKSPFAGNGVDSSALILQIGAC